MRVTAATIHPIHLPLREPFVVAYARWEAMPAIVARRNDCRVEA